MKAPPDRSGAGQTKLILTAESCYGVTLNTVPQPPKKAHSPAS